MVVNATIVPMKGVPYIGTFEVAARLLHTQRLNTRDSLHTHLKAEKAKKVNREFRAAMPSRYPQEWFATSQDELGELLAAFLGHDRFSIKLIEKRDLAGNVIPPASRPKERVVQRGEGWFIEWRDPDAPHVILRKPCAPPPGKAKAKAKATTAEGRIKAARHVMKGFT